MVWIMRSRHSLRESQPEAHVVWTSFHPVTVDVKESDLMNLKWDQASQTLASFVMIPDVPGKPGMAGR